MTEEEHRPLVEALFSNRERKSFQGGGRLLINAVLGGVPISGSMMIPL